jgi:hypothetical protein
MKPEGSLSCSQQPNTVTCQIAAEGGWGWGDILKQMVANIPPISSVHTIRFVNVIPKHLNFPCVHLLCVTFSYILLIRNGHMLVHSSLSTYFLSQALY